MISIIFLFTLCSFLRLNLVASSSEHIRRRRRRKRRKRRRRRRSRRKRILFIKEQAEKMTLLVFQAFSMEKRTFFGVESSIRLSYAAFYY
jgi:hypothetical protein